MFSFGKKKGPTLGLDINSDSITLIQLDKTRVGIEVARFACQPTPANAIREGLIADPEAIGSVVMDLLGQANIPPSGSSPIVNVAVPAQAVVIRLMPVPTGMPPEELADVVTQEATNHVPFPIEDANLDWSQMPATERTDADGVRRIDIILAAIQRSIIESYWRMADSAGVRLGRVDISSLSVVRALALAGYLGSSGHLSMIVNIRHDATDINLVRSAMPLFGRSIMLGMDTLTEAISRSLDVHFDQALDLLPEITIYGGAPTDARMGQAAQVARTVFSDITDELQRSLEFYKSQVGDVKVDQIILSGPGCMIPQIDQFIASRMNIKTIVCDPMRDLVFDSETIVDRMRPILAALIGSSIEPSWNPSFTVDLDLNKEGRQPLLYDERATQVIAPEERPTPWFKPLVAASVATMVLAGAGYGYFTAVDIPNKEKQLQLLGDQIVDANKQITLLTKLKESNSVLADKKKVLDAIVKKANRWSKVLEAIRASTPPGAQLNVVSFTGQKGKVQGVARDFHSAADLSVNLSGSPLVKDSSVEWVHRRDRKPSQIVFSIDSNFVPPDASQIVTPTIIPASGNNPSADGAREGAPDAATPNLQDAIKTLKSLPKKTDKELQQ